MEDGYGYGRPTLATEGDDCAAYPREAVGAHRTGSLNETLPGRRQTNGR